MENEEVQFSFRVGGMTLPNGPHDSFHAFYDPIKSEEQDSRARKAICFVPSQGTVLLRTTKILFCRFPEGQVSSSPCPYAQRSLAHNENIPLSSEGQVFCRIDTIYRKAHSVVSNRGHIPVA